MKGKRLNPLDWTFLAAETRESMMHIGSLMPFSPPPDATPGLLRELMDEIRGQVRAYPPWNLKLRYPNLLAHPLQSWVEDEAFDVEYHVRRSALPSPGDERELGILVSRLHSHSLDFHHPPWEIHFIEGLNDGRFAMYFKVHHALIDGYSGIQLLSKALSPKASERHTPLFFAQPPSARRKEGGATPPATPPATLETLLGFARDQIGSTRSISKALINTWNPQTELVAPMQAPKSPINQRIGRNRRFATQTFEVERLKRAAKQHGATLNDVVLALCAQGLRELLLEQGALPTRPLTAMLPVNIRPKDDPGGGNVVGAILATLATDLADPVERLQAIVASTRVAKAQLQGMTQAGIMQYSALLMLPMMFSQIPGAIGRVRPAFNLVISNVPGPSRPLYFRGFRMEAYYPMSIPFQGYGLNVTVVSYVDRLDFGFIGCRDGLPHLQRLAVIAREALEALESAA